GRPVAVSQMYLRPDATAAIAERWADPDWLPAFLEGGPDLPDQLASLYGIQVAVCDVTIELTALNEFEADLLGVPAGSQAFLLRPLDVDGAAAPVSFARTVIRGDQSWFSLSLRQEQAAPQARAPSLLPYLS